MKKYRTQEFIYPIYNYHIKNILGYKRSKYIEKKNGVNRHKLYDSQFPIDVGYFSKLILKFINAIFKKTLL